MIMKNFVLFLWMVLLGGTCSAKSECDLLRDAGFTLLPNTTFEVRYAEPLNGCFSGYLSRGAGELYRFGVFKNGEELVSLPLVTLGMDLFNDNYLKILATSFNDIDHDGNRDIMIIGNRLFANGGLTFVQIYWGCGSKFSYDVKANSEVNWLMSNVGVINVKKVEKIVASKKMKSTC